MSAGTHYLRLASSIIKQPVTWLVSIVGTLATGFVTDSLAPVTTYVSQKISEKSCEYRQSEVSDDSQFKILISQLAKDPDRAHRDHVMRAFQNEEGILAVPICDMLSVDHSKDTKSAADVTKQRAEKLIKEMHADLLLFGEVTEQSKAIVIYAVNENGGCDLEPKATEIKLGVLPGEFTAEEKEKLIEVSLKEIAAACRNQSSVDWASFGKRINKMAMFLHHVDFRRPMSLYSASAYVEAARLLYRNGQGDIWFSKGDEFAKAILAVARSDDQDTRDALGSVYISQAFLFDEKFQKTKDPADQSAAVDAYSKAIDLDPKDAFAYYYRGLDYTQKRAWDRAIEDFTTAITLDSKDAFTYGERGFAYSNQSDWDRAIDDYTKAINLEPKDANTYRRRGFAFGQKDEWDRAIADYTTAIGLDAQHAPTYGARGYAHSQKGEWDRAISDYTTAIDLDPKLAAAYSGRGDAYRNQREWDRAIADYTNEIALTPKQECGCAYGSRGLAYLARSEWDRAIEDYTNAVELNPKHATAYLGRGSAHSQKGEWDLAVEDYNHAIGLDPKNAALLNGRCWVRAISGRQLHQALADCNKALDLEPSSAATYDSRALVYLKSGKLEAAIADYNKALTLDPNLGGSLFGRGIAQVRSGKIASGNSDIDAAKRIQPDVVDEFARYGIRFERAADRPPSAPQGSLEPSRRRAAR